MFYVTRVVLRGRTDDVPQVCYMYYGRDRRDASRPFASCAACRGLPTLHHRCSRDKGRARTPVRAGLRLLPFLPSKPFANAK
jgi:hypothetical protein